MAGGNDGREAEEVRTPLLAPARVPRKNSATSMRGEFVARLPDKVRHGVDLERPFALDVSRAKDLIEGEVIAPLIRLPSQIAHRSLFLGVLKAYCSSFLWAVRLPV